MMPGYMSDNCLMYACLVDAYTCVWYMFDNWAKELLLVHVDTSMDEIGALRSSDRRGISIAAR